jgi:trk system potassium uptake protein TrkA
MRIGIAGAGAVGRSVAQELVDGGHKVLLIEWKQDNYEPRTVPGADWLLADACELATLKECGMETCDVVICATGDDKVNLSVALMAKSEFAVARVVARVNDMNNEWLFTEEWGVDVAVSAPRAMVAGVEEAIVDTGRLVQFMGLRSGQANVAKLTLPQNNPLIGERVRDLEMPYNAALISVLRGDTVILPRADDVLAAGDEMWFCADLTAENQIREIVHGSG